MSEPSSFFRHSSLSPHLSFEPPVAFINVKFFGPVRLGRHSYMNDGMVRHHTLIGRYCSIGRHVTIAAGDHHTDALTTHPVGFKSATRPRRPPGSLRTSKHSTTEIGNDVWIGDNVVVLSGVHIGDGAVIGANAVVTKDVEPYAIVGGVPAKLIRFRFDEKIITDLLDVKWWLLPYDDVLSLDMNNVPKAIEQVRALRRSGRDDPQSFIAIDQNTSSTP